MLEIRKAKMNDFKIIDDVHIACYREIYNGFITPKIENNMELSKDERLKEIEKQIKDSNPYILAFVDEKLVGVIKYGVSDNLKDAEIKAMYILEEYHHQDIDKKLFLSAIDELKDKYDTMILGCLDGLEDNEFYLKMGGKLIEQIKDNGILENIYYYSDIKSIN